MSIDRSIARLSAQPSCQRRSLLLQGAAHHELHAKLIEKLRCYNVPRRNKNERTLVASSMTQAVSPKEMSRREFLTLCGIGAVAGLLAACGTETPGPTPSPTKQPSLTAADWSALARALQGTLVRPGSPHYPTARQLFS